MTRVPVRQALVAAVTGKQALGLYDVRTGSKFPVVFRALMRALLIRRHNKIMSPQTPLGTV
jgi:hypothetical protein